MALMKAAGGSSLERLHADLLAVAATLRDARPLRLMLVNPVIPEAKKRAVFEELFAKVVSPDTLSLLGLLLEKRRESLLPEIIEAFGTLRDLREGIVNVDVVTKIALTPAQEQTLIAELTQHTGKKVRMRLALDDAIKGGLIVRIGDRVLDASISRQLQLLRERLTSAANGIRSTAH